VLYSQGVYVFFEDIRTNQNIFKLTDCLALVTFSSSPFIVYSHGE